MPSPHRTLLVLAAATVALVVRPTPADAFQCRAPAKVALVSGGRTLPTNTQLFLRTRQSPEKLAKLALVNASNGRKVKATLERGGGPLRLVPARALLPAGRYRLELDGKPLATFDTGAEAEPGLSPTLGEVSVRFSQPHLPDPNTPAKRARYRGRDATLVVGEPTQVRPVAVVVQARWEPSQGKPVQRTLLLPWAREIPIASIRPCTPISTPAPVEGTYAITATPWSASGHRGKPVTLIGDVR